MRIRTDQRIRERPTVAADYAFSQVFEIDLMANPHTGRHDGKILEGLLRPFEDLIPFGVAFVFVLYVFAVSVVRSKKINLYGVIDDQIDGHLRINFRTILSFADDLRTNGRYIDHGGHSGKVLHQYPRGFVRYGLITTRRIPVDQLHYVFVVDQKSVVITQCIFQ